MRANLVDIYGNSFMIFIRGDRSILQLKKTLFNSCQRNAKDIGIFFKKEELPDDFNLTEEICSSKIPLVIFDRNVFKKQSFPN